MLNVFHVIAIISRICRRFEAVNLFQIIVTGVLDIAIGYPNNFSRHIDHNRTE